MSDPAAGLRPGVQIGPYEVLGAVGAGGMGEVYRARDPRLGRDVAIKVIGRGLASDPERVRRFEQEARAASALSDPAIVTVHDVGSFEGAPYLVLELLAGETLRARLAHGPLSPRRALAIAAEVARGLAAAHEAGIVHRDLKPENLFLTRDDRVKILDFGLAKLVPRREGASAVEQATTLADGTVEGTLLGTVGYMAPEQVAGGRVDARADLFALGAVLYEMLTGRRAFRGDSAIATLHAILEEEPEDLAAVVPGIGEGMHRTVRHCLEKDPARRFQNARDLAFALATIEPARATPRGPTPARGWLVGAAMAAVLAAGSGWVVGRRTAPAWAAPDAVALRFLTFSGHDSAPALSPDGRTVAFVSDRDGTSRIWLKLLEDGEEKALTAGPDFSPRFTPDGSAVLFAHLDGTSGFGHNDFSLARVSTLGGAPRTLVRSMSGWLDVSPDGRRLAFSRVDDDPRVMRGYLLVADADGTNVREVGREEGRDEECIRWSPDGARIATVSNLFGATGVSGEIALWDVANGARRALATAPFSLPSALVWRGSQLLYARPSSAGIGSVPARVLEIEPATERSRPLLGFASPVTGLDLAANGMAVLAAQTISHNLREIPLAIAGSDAHARWLTSGFATNGGPVYGPDGRWLLFSSDRGGDNDVWEVSTRDVSLRRLTAAPGEDWDAELTRDGKELLWSSSRTGHFEVWAAAADGSGAHQVTHDGVDAENPSAVAASDWLVYTSGNPRSPGVWKIRQDGSGATRLASQNFSQPAVSPDGVFVAFVGARGEVRCLRLSDGLELGASPALGDAVRLRWFPDGRAVAVLVPAPTGSRLLRLSFDPGKGFTPAIRTVLDEVPGGEVRMFAISPDGSRVVLPIAEQTNTLYAAEGLAGVATPR